MQGPIWHVPMTFEKKTKKEYFLNLRKKNNFEFKGIKKYDPNLRD